MTSNNPLDPGAGSSATPQVPSSEELGLEQRVHDFPNTDLDEAVERGYVDPEAPPSSVEHLPEAQVQPETESTDESNGVSRRTLILGGLGLVTAGGAIALVAGKLLGDNSSSGKAANSKPAGSDISSNSTLPPSTTPPTTAPETSAPVAEKLPLLQLPTSDDPLGIGHQLYANKSAWLNTNDSRYGDYVYTDSNNVNQVKQSVANAAETDQQYRNNHPSVGFRTEFDITLLNNSAFSPVNVLRSVTYDVVERQLGQNGEELQRFHYIDSLSLKKSTLQTSPNSSQTIDGWLIDGQTEDPV